MFTLIPIFNDAFATYSTVGATTEWKKGRKLMKTRSEKWSEKKITTIMSYSLTNSSFKHILFAILFLCGKILWKIQSLIYCCLNQRAKSTDAAGHVVY